MAENDNLSAALSKILNAERVGKKECVIRPVSKVIKQVLDILNRHDYVGKYEISEDGRGGKLIIKLAGGVNKCGSIKPRFSAKVAEYEKWEKRYLPAKGFGILIVSTSDGIMSHEEAKIQKIGGKLLAYCY